jgi:UDP-N-acetylglucosamine--N-acetylmuramyl-(pentapeptide) pyrophosphoryl-undecaprenol N-acetylglucosamine transferase
MHAVLAGGGTAGHIEPAMSLADALRRGDPAVGITALGTARGLETTLVPARGYPLELIPAVPLPRRPGRDLLRVPANLAAAVRRTGQILQRVGADVVVGFGGYVAMPAYVAARRHRVPIVVHEANARPGIANRIGARLTPYVAVGMPGSRLPHARYLGIPLRRSIATLDREAERAAARRYFGLRADLPTLLVVGGSSGARRLNQVMSTAAADVVGAGVQVLHAVGRGNPLPVETPREAAPYVAVPYVERMDLAYAAADLAMCRAGATTCAELAAVGLPAAYVPLPIGNGEQRLNAAPVVAAGGGVLVEDADLDAVWIRRVLLPLLADRERLAGMGKAAAGFGRRDADETLAALVREAAGRLDRAAGGEGPRR